MGFFSKQNLKQQYEAHDIRAYYSINQKFIIPWRQIKGIDEAINTAVEYSASQDHNGTYFSIKNLAEKIDCLHNWGNDKLNLYAQAQIKTILALNPYLFDMLKEELVDFMDRYIAYCRLINTQQEERNSLKKKLDDQFNQLIYPAVAMSITYEQVIASYTLYRLKLANKLKAENKIDEEQKNQLIRTAKQELLDNGFATRKTLIANIVMASILTTVSILFVAAYVASPYIPILASICPGSIMGLIVVISFLLGLVAFALGSALLENNSHRLFLYNRSVKPAYDEIFSDKLDQKAPTLEHTAGTRLEFKSEVVEANTSAFTLLDGLKSLVPCCSSYSKIAETNKTLDSRYTIQPVL